MRQYLLTVLGYTPEAIGPYLEPSHLPVLGCAGWGYTMPLIEMARDKMKLLLIFRSTLSPKPCWDTQPPKLRAVIES